MKVSVTAVRDSDGKNLGENVFDITDKAARTSAVTELLNAIYNASPDPLTLPPFTLRFDKA